MKRAGIILVVSLVAISLLPAPAIADTLPNENGPVADPGVSLNASDGPNVTLGETTEWTNTNPWVSDQNITLEPWGSVTSNGPTALTVDEFNGTWTRVSAVDANGHLVTIKPNDKPTAAIGGDIERFNYSDSIALDDASADFEYGGPSGTAIVQLHGVPANTDIAAVDADTGSLLDAERSDGSGVVTFDELSQSDHTVELQSYDSSDPDIDNSSMSPSGTSRTVPSSIDLSVDVSDGDFPNDNLTVDFHLDGNEIGTKTLTSNGTATLTVTDDDKIANSHDWYVEVSDDYDNTQISKTESYTFEPAVPTASNLSPDGSSSEDDPNDITLEADVADADFSNDELTVEFSVDGSVVDSQTITSNQTVTTTVSEPIAGTHDWSVNVTDKFGESSITTSEFVIANELKIYNESAPSKLVDNVTTEIEYYFRDGSGKIVTRNTTDGTINMTGLSATQPFVVVAEADGFVSRRIFVKNLSETQEVFLLPDNVDRTKNEFVIRDLSGYYPQEDTVLVLQRNLESEWKTVHGDYFGADGSFPAQLRYNKRHRLIVRNTKTGRSRRLGSYTPQSSGEVVIEIESDGSTSIADKAPNVRIDPSTRSLLPQEKNITITIDERNSTIEDWDAEFIARNATTGSNSSLLTISESDALRRTAAVNLTEHGRGKLYVKVTWRASGLDGSETAVYQIARDYNNDHSLLAILGSVELLLPEDNVDQFQNFFAIVLTIVLTIGFASNSRASTEVVGLVALGQIGAWSIAGWLPYPIMFAGVMGYIAFAALRRGL